MRGVAQVALAASLWGTWSLFLRPTELPGVVTAPIILAVMGVAAFALVRVEGRPAPRWTRSTLLLLLLYAGLDALNVGAFFAAMEQTTVAVAVLTHCTAPVLVALLAPRLEGTRVEGSVAAALIALAGLALLLRPWEQASAQLWLGGGLGLLSAVAYASLVFTVQPLAARIGIGRATSYHALLASLLLVPFAVPHASTTELTDVLLLGLGGLLPGTLGAYLFLDGLRRIGSARSAVLTLLEPAVAVLVGFTFFGEVLAPIGALGAAMVLGAATWVARGERKPRRTDEARAAPP